MKPNDPANICHFDEPTLSDRLFGLGDLPALVGELAAVVAWYWRRSPFYILRPRSWREAAQAVAGLFMVLVLFGLAVVLGGAK